MFHFERGERFSEQEFETENGACCYFLELSRRAFLMMSHKKPPMDLNKLEQSLKAAGVPSGDYSIGRPDENTYVILSEFGQWKTFFYEKGARSLEMGFQSEDEACQHVFEELTHPYQNKPCS